MKKNTLDKIINFYIIFTLLTLFINSIFYTYELINCDILSTILIIIGIAGLLIYIVYRIKFKINRIWDFLVVIIVFFLYLSYYFAFDKRVALWGYISGREGLLVIISYYIIFLVASLVSNNSLKDLIIKILSLFGLVQVFYTFLQIYDISTIISLPVVGEGFKYGSGFLYNSNFLGTFFVIMCGLWMPKYFFENEKKNSIFSFIFFLLFLLGILMCGTMSAFVSVIFMFIFNILYLFFRYKQVNLKMFFIKFIIIMLSILFSNYIMFNLFNSDTGTEISNDVVETGQEIVNTVVGEVNENYGTGRFYIWRETLKYIPDYLLTGVGIDNFAYLGYEDNTYIYDSSYKWSIVFKAHNEYMQILSCEGIFTLLFYIILMGMIFILSSIKLIKDKKINIIFFSLYTAFCGYLGQAFFNIRITLLAPIFFIICGLLVSMLKSSKVGK